MRQAGEVIRSDIGMHMDGTPKGNGTVVFTDPEFARAAIGESSLSTLTRTDPWAEMFHGFDWFGNILEVREVSKPPSHSYMC